jgi:hypothetical protein
MLQPCPGSVREEKGEVADDEVVVIRPSQLARQPVICKPQLWPCLPGVLGDGGRGSEPGRERRPSYGPAENSRTWRFGQGAPILLTIVASSAPVVVASTHPFLEAGSTVAAVLLVTEAIRGCGYPVPCALGADEASRMRREDIARCSEGHPRLREAELSARRTAASSRRSLSSPWIRRPSVVDGSGIVRSSIAAATRFWPAPLKAGGSPALASSMIRRWTSRAR